MDPLEKTFTTSTLTEIAGCTADTFRTWRNRNGLFPETAGKSGWKRFSLLDICLVRAVVLMTEQGILANHAVWLANTQLFADFAARLQGVAWARFVVVIRNPKPYTGRVQVKHADGREELIDGKDLPAQEILFRRLRPDASLMEAMAESSGIATIINIEEITSQVLSYFEGSVA
ncbi:hypothetical protein [Methylobacterium aerolatum]|uniref:HTH merR-type domain-containing protein n=1 Tax=Methylobacterium aerolatum TaxID=418708 RepID=A0ABU0HXB7_9HYPH|nr:hypothetical protein [Methylobacterium aerolatum]MDQ0446990.1 hypothetical protein [Methylobacterium aerolatum]GJD36779.1 hypothetical protein FMGBMHLM_3702 [Methylobacterium aerolatum]